MDDFQNKKEYENEIYQLWLEKDCFIAKNYSENEGLNEQFIKSGLFEDTGEKVSAGFASCPILRYKG